MSTMTRRRPPAGADAALKPMMKRAPLVATAPRPETRAVMVRPRLADRDMSLEWHYIRRIVALRWLLSEGGGIAPGTRLFFAVYDRADRLEQRLRAVQTEGRGK